VCALAAHAADAAAAVTTLAAVAAAGITLAIVAALLATPAALAGAVAAARAALAIAVLRLELTLLLPARAPLRRASLLAVAPAWAFELTVVFRHVSLLHGSCWFEKGVRSRPLWLCRASSMPRGMSPSLDESRAGASPAT